MLAVSAAVGILPLLSLFGLLLRPGLVSRRSGRSGLVVSTRTVPSVPTQGESARIEVELTNTARWPTPAIELAHREVPRLLPAWRVLVGPVRAGHTRTLVLDVPAVRRGRYDISEPVALLRDPFALVRARVRLEATASELVIGAGTVPLEGLPRTRAGLGTSSGHAPSGTLAGAPDVGIRPYAVGDDIRTIHWRASARLEDGLVVRTHTEPGLGQAELVVDDRPSAYRGGAAGLDVAACLVSSIAEHLLAQDVALAVHDAGGRVIAEGHDAAHALPLALAGLGSAPSGELRPVAPGPVGLLIAVVGTLRAEEAARLAGCRGPGGLAVAMVVGTGRVAHDGAARLSDDGAAHLAGAGWRVVRLEVDEEVAAGQTSARELAPAIARAWREVVAW